MAMAEKTPLIALRLEGALQSWGDHSKWDERDSGSFPSKSGVVGLIACAMGLERGSEELLALADAIHLAVRADRPGMRAMDFQTVKGNPLRTAEGQRKLDASTVVSNRWYLEDASFLVLIDTDEFWRERIVEAIKQPKWPVYLGRKSCVPSRPVFECVTEEYSCLAEALERFPLCERCAEGEYVNYESEVPVHGAPNYTRTDALTGAGRGFSKRVVYTGALRKETVTCT